MDIKVGMADLNVCSGTDTITTLGLGSCVGVVLWDAQAKVCGMLHAMLPDSTSIRNNSNVAKFVDSGIDELLKRVLAKGARRQNLVAKSIKVKPRMDYVITLHKSIIKIS